MGFSDVKVYEGKSSYLGVGIELWDHGLYYKVILTLAYIPLKTIEIGKEFLSSQKLTLSQYLKTKCEGLLNEMES